MYYSNYEDYMRMVLGYPMENTDSTYRNDNNWYSAQNNVNSLISNPEELYPEIYRKINPAVCQMCDKNVEPLTKELLEQMTEQIYNTVEGDVNSHCSKLGCSLLRSISTDTNDTIQPNFMDILKN